MSNNKQQTAVDLFAERTFNLIELMKRKWVNQEEFLDGMLKARNEAKEMEKERLEKTWIEALDYGINNLKGLNNLSSKEAFDKWYNETYGGNK
jgi:hypothetical protein